MRRYGHLIAEKRRRQSGDGGMHMSVKVDIGVNFYKAARLEPPPPLFRLQGFQAFEPPTFSSCMIRGIAHLF